LESRRQSPPVRVGDPVILRGKITIPDGDELTGVVVKLCRSG
jgi:hypothetical protein